MTHLKHFSTNVLISMVRAHSAYYGRALSADELRDCKQNIEMLQAEIDSRKAEIDSRKQFHNPINTEKPEFKVQVHC